MDKSLKNIGKNLHEQRKRQQLSFDQLSERTGVSKSMLRQIETGQSTPTIATLWKIAHGLRISFSCLMSAPPSEAEVKSFKGEEAITERDQHSRLYPLVPFSVQQPFEVFYFEIDPETTFKAGSHGENLIEYIFVTAGELKLTIEDKVYLIKQGEFIQFKANKPHIYQCMSEQAATAMVMAGYEQ